MERLEAAIKKARGQQGGQRPAQMRRPDGAHGPVTAPVQEAWDNLPLLDLNRKELKKNRIISLDPVPEATAFDVLRTRTLRQLQEHGWRRLAITSPTAGCGKSTLALNIALSLSRQQKIRTVEIEMDMRRPSQERLLGVKKPKGSVKHHGVPELLTGKATFAEVGKRIGSNLALVVNDSSQTNASDILLDDNIGQVLDDIEAQYKPDIMLFDMPPVLLTDDTLAFMQHVDCALIVAAAEATTTTEVDLCERELAAQTNVMGVVLNKCRLASRSYGGYDYAYGYGY